MRTEEATGERAADDIGSAGSVMPGGNVFKVVKQCAFSDDLKDSPDTKTVRTNIGYQTNVMPTSFFENRRLDVPTNRKLRRAEGTPTLRQQQKVSAMLSVPPILINTHASPGEAAAR